ncbi:hypothetical protein RMCBS344292_06757 [Rhizopus microsporus]|nr:hypothetical protein RMCBS344292_06757 [Rhizopus microsporus]
MHNLSRQFIRQFKRHYAAIQQQADDYKINLLGLTLDELQEEIATVPNVRPYTALQLWQQIYQQGHTQFDEMTNLSKELQNSLSDKYKVYYGDIKVNIVLLLIQVILNRHTVG